MRPSTRILLVLLVLLAHGIQSSTFGAASSPELATAIEHYTARRDAEAKAAFEAILKRDERDHEAHYYLARLAKRERNWDAVVLSLEKALKFAPDNAIYWGDLGEAYGAQARTAGLFSQLGLAKKTRESLEKAVSFAPDNLEIRIGLITFYREAPRIAGGGMDKAFAEVEIVRAQDPFRGAMVIGGLYQQEKRWAEAEAEYREASRIRPESADPSFALAQLFALSGRYDEAFVVFEDLLQTNPQNFAALYQIGRVAAVSGQRLDRGEAALREYLSSPQRASRLPSHAHAWNRLGNVLEKKGDKPAARDAYRKALELDPKLKDAEESLKKLKH